MSKKDKPEKEEKKEVDRELLEMQKFLDDNVGDHYNDLPEITYKISTGSLKLDAKMGGGYGPGIHRLGGASEGGKTSHALKVAANFLETVPNSKVCYIKAEGRLSKKMKRRSGMKFVDSVLDWVVGTAWVFKCNIYDSVGGFIEARLQNNPNNIKYLFIIDSVDSMIMRADQQKQLGGDDAVKVAGPNVFTKLLFKKCSLPCSELGHMIFPIAQVIARIEVKHTKPDQLNVGGGGGNAQIHFADWCLQFMPRFQKDLIVNDGCAPDNGSNKIIFDGDDCNICGHWCNVTISKSSNETTMQTVKYPIRYNADGDGSIWNELEIKDLLEGLQIIEVKGAWISFNDVAMKLMEDAGVPAQQKINGSKKFLAYISDPALMKFWRGYIRDMFAEDNEIL